MCEVCAGEPYSPLKQHTQGGQRSDTRAHLVKSASRRMRDSRASNGKNTLYPGALGTENLPVRDMDPSRMTAARSQHGSSSKHARVHADTVRATDTAPSAATGPVTTAAVTTATATAASTARTIAVANSRFNTSMAGAGGCVNKSV